MITITLEVEPEYDAVNDRVRLLIIDTKINERGGYINPKQGKALTMFGDKFRDGYLVFEQDTLAPAPAPAPKLKPLSEDPLPNPTPEDRFNALDWLKNRE